MTLNYLDKNLKENIIIFYKLYLYIVKNNYG
jgi:hypothetical protein